MIHTSRIVNLFFLVSLLTYGLVINLSNDMYIPAINDVMHGFNVDENSIKFTIIVWFIGAMILNPILGIISDLIGVRKTLLYSGVCFLISTFYCMLPNQTLYLFMIARFFQGVSAAASVICGYSIIHKLYEEKRSILIVSYLSGILILAPLLGPLLGSIVLHIHNEWHFIFEILFSFAFVLWISLYFFIPKCKSREKSKSFYIKNITKELASYRKILTNSEFYLATFMEAILFAVIIFWITVSPIILLVDFHYSSIIFSLLQAIIFSSYIVGILVMKYCLYSKEMKQMLLKIGVFSVYVLTFLMGINYFLANHNIVILFLGFFLFAFLSGLFSGPLNRVIVTINEDSSAKAIAMFDFFCGLLAFSLISVKLSGKSNLAVVSNVVTYSSLFFLCLLTFFGRKTLSKFGEAS